ncbi:MAG: hypothetical protein ACRBK7_22665 [Acidimicrobiales bacterium]
MSACKRCNSEKAGATFESDPVQIVQKDAEHEAGTPPCGIHGTDHADAGFYLGWIADHVPVTLADIKSAYLVAFAVLGYSWACSRALDPDRDAFDRRKLPPEEVAFATSGLLGLKHQRNVVEIISPLSTVTVIGPSADVVVLFLTDIARGQPQVVRPQSQGKRVHGRHFVRPLMVRQT